MLRGLWAAYERSLASRPVLTQAATSSVLWGLGDCLAQRIEAYERAHHSGIAADITLGSAMAGSSAGTAAAAVSVDKKTSNDSDALAALDTHRVAATATFGAAFIGPVGHAWYLGLEGGCRRLFPAGGSAFLAAKVAVDSVGMGSLYVASFFAFGSMVLERSGWEGFVRKMQARVPDAHSSQITWAAASWQWSVHADRAVK